MKKKLLITGVVVLIVIGAGVGYFVWNNISNQPAETVEQSSDLSLEEVQQNAEAPQSLLKQGQFVDGDAVHSASGTATIVKTDKRNVLKFENFSVTNGPDLFVYLSPNEAGQDLGEFVSLGKLKNNSGDQVYELPDNVDQYQTVVIWCRAFNVTFGTASLDQLNG